MAESISKIEISSDEEAQEVTSSTASSSSPKKPPIQSPSIEIMNEPGPSGSRRNHSVAELHETLRSMSLSSRQSAKKTAPQRSQSCEHLKESDKIPEVENEASGSSSKPTNNGRGESCIVDDLLRMVTYFQEKDPSINGVIPLTMDVYLKTMNMLWKQIDPSIEIKSVNYYSVGDYLKKFNYHQQLKTHVILTPTAPQNFHFVLGIWIWLLDTIEAKNHIPPLQKPEDYSAFGFQQHLSDFQDFVNEVMKDTKSLPIVTTLLDAIKAKNLGLKQSSNNNLNDFAKSINSERCTQFQTDCNQKLSLLAERCQQVDFEIRYFRSCLHKVYEQTLSSTHFVMQHLPNLQKYMYPNNGFSPSDVIKELLDFKEGGVFFKVRVLQDKAPLAEVTKMLSRYIDQINSCIAALQLENSEQMHVVKEMRTVEKMVDASTLHLTPEFEKDFILWKSVRMDIQVKISRLTRIIFLLRGKVQKALADGNKELHIIKLCIMQGFTLLQLVCDELIHINNPAIMVLTHDANKALKELHQMMLENIKCFALLVGGTVGM